MPALTTHYILGNEIAKKLNNEGFDHINTSLTSYLIFNQSHDILYYSMNKTYNELGSMGHHEKTKDFIVNIIKYIKQTKQENNDDVIAFLYGIINHYVLDSICHPFIFYYSGAYHSDEKETRKYHGVHADIERQIDRLMYERFFNKNYQKCNITKDIIKKPYIPKETIDLINHVYKETYGVENTAIEYIKNIKKIKLINTLFINDRFGIKHFLYNIFDKISFNAFGVVAAYSNSVKTNPKYLNLDNKEWLHPVTGDKRNESFIELFNKAEEIALNIIKDVNKVLYDNKPLSILDNVIKDWDYATGIEIKDNYRMRHFAF